MGTTVRTAQGRKEWMREKLIAEQAGLCAICGQPLGEDVTLDHIIPRSLGGPWKDWNLQAAHRACNAEKDSKLVQSPKRISAISYPPVNELLQFIADNPGDTIQTIAIGLNAVVSDTYRNLGHLYTHGKIRFEKPSWTASGDYLFWKWYAEE